MAPDNVEIVRRFFELNGRGDWSRLELLAADVRYFPIAEITESGEWRGRDGFRSYQENFAGAWVGFDYAPTSIRPYGDRVIARVELRGRGRVSGLELAARVFQVFTLRGSEIVRIEDFVDRVEALAAAGAAAQGDDRSRST